MAASLARLRAIGLDTIQGQPIALLHQKARSPQSLSVCSPATTKMSTVSPHPSAPAKKRIDADHPKILAVGDKFSDLNAKAVTCLSYNVLLPNGNDGWWIHKYYRKWGEHTAWPRRKALLRKQIASASADIVCFQECCDGSFEEDFDFMMELGYKGQKHTKKHEQGSPATFWKTDRIDLVNDIHKNKTLVTALKVRGSLDPIFFVVNCHLPGKPDDALRCVEDALKAVATEAGKQKLERGKHGFPCIVCGDFNSQGRTAVDQFLVNGKVGPDFREASDLTKQIINREKSQTIGCFAHAYCEAYGDEVPPTMFCPNLFPKMLNGDGSLTPEVVAAIDRAFRHLSGGNAVMDLVAVETYLLAICQGLSDPLARLSTDLSVDKERRAPWSFELKGVQDMFQASGAQQLTFNDFLSTYARALQMGKPWVVEYDLRALGGAGMAVPSEGPCKLCLDHIYFTPAMRLVGVQALLTKDQEEALNGPPWDVLPNEWHPSDHLPIAAAFTFA